MMNMTTSLPANVKELRVQNDPRLAEIIGSLKGIDDNAICVCIIGSTTFNTPKTQPICEAIGQKIAGLNVVLFTGSTTCIQETVSKKAADSGLDAKRIRHLCPGGDDAQKNFIWKDSDKYGIWHTVGNNLDERREALARTSRLFVLIEGGPGACHEANEALAAGGIVLPIAATLGAAGGRPYPTAPKESMRSIDQQKIKESARKILDEGDYNVLTNKEELSGEPIAEIIAKAIKTLEMQKK